MGYSPRRLCAERYKNVSYLDATLGRGRTPGVTFSSIGWFLRSMEKRADEPGFSAATCDSSCVTSVTGCPAILTMTSPGRMPASAAGPFCSTPVMMTP